jgi:bifunctional non-homologous end joining protein LigD
MVRNSKRSDYDRGSLDPVLRLPEPMLARSGPIPTGAEWIFEPKLDGFRLLSCTHGGRFRARSRRGWNMTSLLPELGATLPPNLQLDGEIVALNTEGVPDFHRLGSRLLHGRRGIDVTYFVFDVLAVEGLAVTAQPYRERRELLEALEVEGKQVRLVATFEDGEALFSVVCERGLEGVVAKRERDPYRPGSRAWIKSKNRATTRYAEELAGVIGRLTDATERKRRAPTATRF